MCMAPYIVPVVCLSVIKTQPMTVAKRRSCEKVKGERQKKVNKRIDAELSLSRAEPIRLLIKSQS